MRRRPFIATIGAGFTLLAGCSSEGSTADGTPTRGTSTATDSGFKLVSVDVPDRTQLATDYHFRVTVENVTDEKRTFTSAVSVRAGDSEWRRLDQRVSVDVPAGETATWESPTVKHAFLRTYKFRLDAFGTTWSVESVPKRLSFGNEYRTPGGFGITVIGGKFEETYAPGSENNTTAAGDSTATPTPTPVSAPDGTKWLLVYLRVRNFAKSARDAPDADEFALHVGDETYAPKSVGPADARYRGDELAGRTVRRDPLVFAAPTDTAAADVTVEWSGTYKQGTAAATWQT